MERMMDFVTYFEDFLGPQTLLTSPVGSDQWKIADTSSTGTPTYTIGGINGEFTAAFDSANEIQNVCLFKGDVLNFDIDLIQSIQFRVRVTGTYNAASSLAFGLCSARNDASTPSQRMHHSDSSDRTRFSLRLTMGLATLMTSRLVSRSRRHIVGFISTSRRARTMFSSEWTVSGSHLRSCST